jgi:hypothetical protein
MRHIFAFVLIAFGLCAAACTTISYTISPEMNTEVKYKSFLQEKDIQAVVGPDGGWEVYWKTNSDPAVRMFEAGIEAGRAIREAAP